MNSSPCLWVFLLTITSATIGKIAGRSPIRITSGSQCIPGVPIPTRHPCSEVCECYDGQIECYHMDCYCDLMDCKCPGLYVPEGECCARCPEQETAPPTTMPTTTPTPHCQDDAIWRNVGDRWTPLPCYNCECVLTSGEAQIVCEDQPRPCEEPQCDNPYDLPNQEHCHCPVCPSPTPPTTTTLPGPACSTVRCAAPQCPEAQQLTLPGECCRICDGPQSECELGKRRKLAGDPCTRCKCKAGDNGITQEVCKTKTCPELSCTETYTLKRKCCPQCAPVCSGVVCPQLVCPQKFQKQKKNACCPRCTRCEGVVCESPDCPEEFQKTKRGECCPTCKRKWLQIQNLLE